MSESSSMDNEAHSKGILSFRRRARPLCSCARNCPFRGSLMKKSTHSDRLFIYGAMRSPTAVSFTAHSFTRRLPVIKVWHRIYASRLSPAHIGAHRERSEDRYHDSGANEGDDKVLPHRSGIG